MKRKLSPQEKAKLNKKLFSLFMTLVFLVCIGLGIYNGLKGIQLPNPDDLTAFDTLKKSNINITTALEYVGLSGYNLNNVPISEVVSVLDGANIDYFTSGSLDPDKWDTDQSASEEYTLVDRHLGAFAKQLYPMYGAVRISIDSADRYQISITERVKFSNIINNSEILQLLPEYAYVTTSSIVHIDDGNIIVDYRHVDAYNNLDQGKSDVITSVIQNGNISILNYSIDRLINFVTTLSNKTHTTYHFSTNSIVFTPVG